MLALVAVAELSPSLPSWRHGFECLHEVSRRFDHPFFGIEVEPHLNRLATLQAGRLAVAFPQWNARRTSHCRDRAPVSVAVQSHLDRCADLAEHGFGIEGQRHKTHRAFPSDLGREGLRPHDTSVLPSKRRRLSAPPEITRFLKTMEVATRRPSEGTSRSKVVLPP